jgi:hypothetical protein
MIYDLGLLIWMFELMLQRLRLARLLPDAMVRFWFAAKDLFPGLDRSSGQRRA